MSIKTVAAKRFDVCFGIVEASTGLRMALYQQLAKLANSVEEYGVETVAIEPKADKSGVVLQLAGRRAYSLEISNEGRLKLTTTLLDGGVAKPLVLGARAHDIGWRGILGAIIQNEKD